MEKFVIRTVCCIVILVLCGILFPPRSHAASRPDAGTILRDLKDEPALPERQPDVKIETKPDVIVREVAGPKVLVKGFRIKGETIFKEEALAASLQEYIGKELTFSELQKAAEKITAYYTAHGYVARAYLPPQEIKDGIVDIAVIEGRFEDVVPDKESDSRLDFQRAKKYITASQGLGEPISMDRLERGMLILHDIPGVAASSTLQPGTKEGMVQQAIKLMNTPFITGNIDLDNTGQRASGEYWLRGGINLNNLSGIGDRISIAALGAFDDRYTLRTQYGRIAYSLPAGYSGLNLGASLAAMGYNLGADFKAMEEEGGSTVYRLFASYPIIRQRQHNLIITATYDHEQLYDEANKVTTSNKRIDVATLGLNEDIFDRLLGGGYTSLGMSFTIGRLDLARCQADFNADQASAKTHGEYKKATLHLSRLQRLAEKTSLKLNLMQQFAFENLDSSEDFSLGGAYGVRAYPAGEASGDEGTLFTVELQQRLTQKISVFGFYDFGRIKTNHTEWITTRIPNSYHLEGIGGGITYITPGDFLVTATIAGRLGNNPDRDASGNDSDGTKRSPRIWVLASKYF